jgi:class 3 adenylate cyclase
MSKSVGNLGMNYSWSNLLRIFAIALLLAFPVVTFSHAQEPSSPESSSTETAPPNAAPADAETAPADGEATDPAAEGTVTTEEEGTPAQAAAPADRRPRQGAFGAISGEAEVVQTNGAFNDWFFNMFAAVAEFAKRPLFIALYALTVLALVVFRVYFDNPVKILGCSLFYAYSMVQTYSLFKENHFVTDFTLDGGLTTTKSVWFAAIFTLILTWGVSRALQHVIVAAMRTGLGSVLAPLDPRKWLDKFRSSDVDLEELEGGSAKNPKRQNTAIMFTDIVGYSAQMGKNEAAMVAKLNIHNEIMRNQIVRNRGTVIKTIGDAFMVRFRSAESAVMCALDCQKAIGEYNKGKTPEDQFHIRIGCHMGEVIHTGTDVFGEGVNIAARIEPKCDPDGVTVSDVIANAARNKVPAHFSSIGRHPMKNIANPPELFKVFPIEAQAVQKTGKTAPAAAGATGGTPGGTFKI